ncbi:MBL fold metallo-hydrolase [Clostridium culturomicium]|uniref:MBL fold metallo-hydrolase n=1 Tax=Clostridium culturomicium TaxID=1499683 RepID=UPI000590F37B|nr:MBL fold metallo-hydrolase [Clostridium culturomicium]
MIIKRVMAGVNAANCYIVFDEETREAVVLDPGGDVDDICKALNQFGATVKYIVLTHGHFDHTTGVEELKSIVGAPVAIGFEDNEMVLKGAMYYGPLPDGGADILLKDGDTLKFGGHTMTVIETPGHTPGGICLLVENDIFTGDTLFAGSIGRTDLAGGDYDTIIHSIKFKLMSLADTVAVHPGHGPSSTINREKLMNPFMR